MDFTAYPRHSGRDAWETTRTSERVPGNQNSNDTGKFLQHPWQSNSEITPSGLYLQGPPVGQPITHAGTSKPLRGVSREMPVAAQTRCFLILVSVKYRSLLLVLSTPVCLSCLNRAAGGSNKWNLDTPGALTPAVSIFTGHFKIGPLVLQFI
ncbi:hypothetical protein Pyn_03407 [Prunus yedoensis var. nudiflora]|uniref:Uncharacterized protein n=1 Tax=Prunus yedoensis var. nudiflora TaxID=2094558 RepID=A0A314YYZ1_PRUYE|nr:hypothetical protein Pyn_03407 [Prunus yedoensis var. nudiflora]